MNTNLKYLEGGVPKSYNFDGDTKIRRFDDLYRVSNGKISITIPVTSFISMENVGIGGASVEKAEGKGLIAPETAVAEITKLNHIASFKDILSAYDRDTRKFPLAEAIGKVITQCYGRQGEIDHLHLRGVIPELYDAIRGGSYSTMSRGSVNCRISDYRMVYVGLNMSGRKPRDLILKLAGVPHEKDWMAKGHAYTSLSKYVREANQIVKPADKLKGI